ncbi:MAG: DUF4384 domain-containing protein [Proteobacteria bacterium]|nr:DUF4384 domain-containing protein [Pseudomonadota bacterium]
MCKIFQLCIVSFLLAGCGVFNKGTAPDSVKLETIPMELTTHLGDQQKFVEGDELQFLLSLGQDAYIYMFYLDAADNITQILPNENQRSNFYTAGYFLTIPEYENHYRFTISGPFGKELIWVFASDKSIALKQTPDSIENIKQFIKKSSDKAYGEYVMNIVTSQREGSRQ